MAPHENTSSSPPAHQGWIKTLLVCVLILAAAAGLTVWIFFTEPTAVREGATRETAMLVEVTRVQRGTYRPTIIAVGTVRPARDVMLQPQVSGQVVDRLPAFTPGGFVREGDELVRIDPADFENALRQRQSDLRRAVADYKIEMGRQNIAERDYALLEEELGPANEALVLREPQLDTVRARVAAARAAVAQAELELQRTRIPAPFDAHVLSRNVDVGSRVAPEDVLGRLVGLDTYWVETRVPPAKLRWLVFPDDATPSAGSTVRVYDRLAWPEDAHRKGRLYKLIGALEGDTRLARVLAEVKDPLAIQAGAKDQPPLMIGAFVEVRIEGRPVRDVVRLDRDYVRQGGTVWVMQDEKLVIREVDIVLQDAVYAYIRQGLRSDDPVVVTNLATVAEGARLRLARPGGPGQGSAADQGKLPGQETASPESGG